MNSFQMKCLTGVLFCFVFATFIPVIADAGCIGVTGRACVRLEGGNAFLSNTNQGLTIFEMSESGKPKMIGCMETKGCVLDMDFANGFAYVVDDQEGLLVIDVSNPERCATVGKYHKYGGGIKSFKIFGQYALAAVSGQGLRVFDISTPAAPQEISRMDAPAQVQSLAVVDRFAYLANFNGGLHVFDLQNPARPVETAFIDLPGRPRGLGVSGSHLFINTSERRMHIMDIASPGSPQMVSFIDIGRSPVAAIAGDRAYIASLDDGFLVFDISDPERIVEVGKKELEGICLAMCISENVVYLSMAENDELMVIDLQHLVSN